MIGLPLLGIGKFYVLRPRGRDVSTCQHFVLAQDSPADSFFWSRIPAELCLHNNLTIRHELSYISIGAFVLL